MRGKILIIDASGVGAVLHAVVDVDFGIAANFKRVYLFQKQIWSLGSERRNTRYTLLKDGYQLVALQLFFRQFSGPGVKR